MTAEDDLQVVFSALMRYKKIASQHRWGGLSGDKELAENAEEALARIGQIVQEWKQPKLFDIRED